MATYELIEHIEASAGSVASIEFTSIPQTYTDLLIVHSVRSTRSGFEVDNLQLNINGQGVNTNITCQILYGTGSSAASDTFNVAAAGLVSAAGATSNTFGSGMVYFPNYTSSAAKSISTDGVQETNTTSGHQSIVASLWNQTAAITSIALDPANGDITQYGSATLYGIRKYNTASAPKATGGIISYDATNDYWVHTFTASGTFTPTENLTAEYLVIAGGGGGPDNRGGGGGAGGYRCSVSGESSGGGASAETPLSLTASTGYTVTVGAGGAGSSSGGNSGSSGSNSVFSSITSDGGGGGAYGANGLSGGSGGGAGYPNYTGGSPSANQGYAGGSGSAGSGSSDGGGGGGGASAVGSQGRPSGDGSGGDGVASSITGSSIYRAGGGGGSNGTSNSDGGLGGGGFGYGGPGGAGESATISTGSGGGGSRNAAGGNGGSGIVIVRYAA